MWSRNIFTHRSAPLTVLITRIIWLFLLTLLVGGPAATAGPIQSAVALDIYVPCGPSNWQYELFWQSPGAILVERVLFYTEATSWPDYAAGHMVAWSHPTGNPYLGYWSPLQFLGPGQTMLEIGGAPVNGLVRILYGCTGPATQGVNFMLILYYRTEP